MSKFNLSDKIWLDELSRDSVYVKDVKEFIKNLKENLCNWNKEDYDINIGIIDKLAGADFVQIASEVKE